MNDLLRRNGAVEPHVILLYETDTATNQLVYNANLGASGVDHHHLELTTADSTKILAEQRVINRGPE